MELTIKQRGKEIQLPSAPTGDMTLGALRASIAAGVGAASPEKTRLFTSGRRLPHDDDARLLRDVLQSGATILVVASSAAAVASVRADAQREAFAATLRDDILGEVEQGRTAVGAKFVAAPRSTANGAGRCVGGGEYGFGYVEALPNMADSHQVEAILTRLATDGGILVAMRERGWRVGALKEMAPAGRVGVDPVCVLGYNVNRGQEIRLRVRTDDWRGFRSMTQLVHVLAHELAHNVEDEHGVAFKETMRWVERRLRGVDWRGAGGRVLADGVSARPVTTADIAGAADERRGGRLGAGQSLGGNVAGVSRLLAEVQAKQQQRREAKGSSASGGSLKDGDSRDGQGDSDTKGESAS